MTFLDTKPAEEQPDAFEQSISQAFIGTKMTIALLHCPTSISLAPEMKTSLN